MAHAAMLAAGMEHVSEAIRAGVAGYVDPTEAVS